MTLIQRPLQASLRAWRHSKGLTLEELAERTGNALSTLAAWEKGERPVNLDKLQELAAFYGVSAAALLMDPEAAKGELTKMQRAADLARRMPDLAVDNWLQNGELLVAPSGRE